MILCLAVVTICAFHIEVQGVDLYSYGRVFESTLTGDDNVTGPISLNTSTEGLKYFGSTVFNAYISVNGIISFDTKIPAYSSKPFPHNDGILKIAIYWANIDTTVNSGVIYYRKLPHISLAVLNSISGTVRAAFTNSTFQATNGLIATWHDVTFFGGSQNSSTNTFQLVIVTDGNTTYTIFTYKTLTWTTGTGSGGNSAGLGGTQAQVGFDSGNGVRYYTVDESQTADVLSLTNTSHGIENGRLIFKVDGSQILSPLDSPSTESTTASTDPAGGAPPLALQSKQKITEGLTTREAMLIVIGLAMILLSLLLIATAIYEMRTSKEPPAEEQNDSSKKYDKTEEKDTRDETEAGRPPHSESTIDMPKIDN